jgi:hypothetical protein
MQLSTCSSFFHLQIDSASGHFMEGTSHYFGCKMEGLEEHIYGEVLTSTTRK